MACNIDVIYSLPPRVRDFVWDKITMFQPDQIHICDGSIEEYDKLLSLLESQGAIKKLAGYQNNWIARTDPSDVARVESRTFISTTRKNDTVPRAREGVKGTLGNWIAPEHLDYEIKKRFPGCMKGRTMYVIPFSMGPVGGPISKIGIEISDSAYVAVSMRTMTRMGKHVLDLLHKDDSSFIKAIHSVGLPKPEQRPVLNGWPCNPEQTIITHIPEKNEIWSFGSGYGGNSLLGKKCFALRLGSKLGQKEGWLAEHMLILGLKTPGGKQHYVAAAFPSACGKTNLAMLEPSLPGYKVTCVGDDIAWMKFDAQGKLRAINPEFGFFGVAPGTSMKTNPNAMRCLTKNCVFTNVAETSDGKFFWEGLEDDMDISRCKITDWTNKDWTPSCGRKAAHPNSRFTAPASQCPIIDPNWESPEGVPIDAIIFGGRRPEGVPLIYESFNWQHGVFVGAAMKSESTAAAEHRAKVIMHDPFAMRPFFGYNCGHYLEHWLSFQNKPGLALPKIYHVNWFRKNADGRFIWPGYGENSRVLDWIVRRLDGSVSAVDTAVGRIPHISDINLTGLKEKVDMNELFRLPSQFWKEEVKELTEYFDSQFGPDFPREMSCELEQLKQRVSKLA